MLDVRAGLLPLLDGAVGFEALDAHLLLPGEDSDAGETVQLDEDRAGTLVAVCAACYRMLHAAGAPSAEQLRHDFQGPRCPACGERTADRIVYGLSVGAALPGHVLGGCIIDDASPDLSCRSWGRSWSEPTPAGD